MGLLDAAPLLSDEAKGRFVAPFAFTVGGLRADCDAVIDLDHTRCCPGGAFSLAAFGPRSDSALENDFPADCLDANPTGVNLGTAPEGLLNVAFDLAGGSSRL